MSENGKGPGRGCRARRGAGGRLLGGLEVVGLAGNRVLARYQGACGTCPSSYTATLLAIENLLERLDPTLELALV